MIQVIGSDAHNSPMPDIPQAAADPYDPKKTSSSYWGRVKRSPMLDSDFLGCILLLVTNNLPVDIQSSDSDINE